MTHAAFDAHARAYDEELQRGLSVSGENRDFFARGRVRFLADCLRARGACARTVLDYGCGTGATTRWFFEELGSARTVGVDVSADSLAVAREQVNDPRAQFVEPGDPRAADEIDLAYCNGIFHHVRPADRPDVLADIKRCVRPGGLFALWENNPWNPGTRLVMSRIPFDRDAIPVSALEARRLATAAGFRVLRVDFLFIFPRALRVFRGIEPLVSRLPLGAQYQVLCERP
jgi:SAM-dependent methyltransferase